MRRSAVAVLWSSGLIQSAVPDVALLTGLVLIGVGISHWSGPATYIYAGAVLVGGSVLVALSRRPNAPKEPS